MEQRQYPNDGNRTLKFQKSEIFELVYMYKKNIKYESEKYVKQRSVFIK